MPGTSTPGALGFGANQPTIDPGTSARINMPVATPVGSGVNTSGASATPKEGSRPMTAGEIAMSRPIFKDSVNYTKVKVHNRGYFGIFTSKRTAVTPNGEIYFLPEDFQEDFSVADARAKRWFMHEMVHVWQYQLGFSVKLHGLFSFMAAYKSTLAPEKRLSDYGMEQQGDIIADYFAIKFLKRPDVVENANYANALALFEEGVLTDFLADPSSKLNLPRTEERPSPANDP